MFLLSCFMFCLSVLMLALFLVCFILLLSCFCFVSCFACTDYLKHCFRQCFPCNSSVFRHVGYKVVLYCFSFMFLLLFVCLFVFFSCVVCFHFRHLICIMLCLCCLVFSFLKPGLSGFVVCILWSSFLFVVLYWIFVFFWFFIPLKKRPPKKPDTAKTQKSKNAEKTDKQKNS